MRQDKQELLSGLTVFAIAMVIAILVILFVAHPSRGQDVSGGAAYEWTQRADYHKSVVQIKAGNSFGSGAYVKHGCCEGILTARHVVAGKKEVSILWGRSEKTTPEAFHNGFNYTVDKYGNDVAFLFAKPPENLDLVPFPIAELEPVNKIEICGFGGPRNQLRHFRTTITQQSKQFLQTNGKVTHGDSGGPWIGMFEGQAKLVGVQSTGGEPIGVVGGMSVYNESHSPRLSSIRNFLARVETQW